MNNEKTNSEILKEREELNNNLLAILNACDKDSKPINDLKKVLIDDINNNNKELQKKLAKNEYEYDNKEK